MKKRIGKRNKVQGACDKKSGYPLIGPVLAPDLINGRLRWESNKDDEFRIEPAFYTRRSLPSNVIIGGGNDSECRKMGTNHNPRDL